MSCETKSDPAAQRVSEIIRFADAELIQYGNDIGGAQREIVSLGIVRLVALAVTSGIEKDDLMIRFQGIDIAAIDQVFTATEAAVVHDKGGPASDTVVMDANALIGHEWHFASLTPWPAQAVASSLA